MPDSKAAQNQDEIQDEILGGNDHYVAQKRRTRPPALALATLNGR